LEFWVVTDKPHAVHTAAQIVIGGVWVFHGLYSKILSGIPRHRLERFKKYCSQFGARIFGFWRGFGEGAGL
jgi:hypothetical protein